jgi:CRISPR-associated protein Cas2
MTVMVLERVPASLRGELTRWMLEPKTGVFVGRPTAIVREKLWQLVCERVKGGAGLLVYQADVEQGFVVRQWGRTSRTVVDFEGLALVTI